MAQYIITLYGVNTPIKKGKEEAPMKEENMRFGEFIKSKRQADERELTLKDVANALNISLSMLSDIEQGRRKPFDSEKIKVFCNYLNLTERERELMYDLAARETRKIPDDIEDIMMYSSSGEKARRALRLTNVGIADESDWEDFIRSLEKKRVERNNG